eukprot:9353432-Karenia_brevis.AAC.1
MSKFADYVTVVMVDANAKVGSAASPAIGPAYDDAETDNGRRMRICLEHLGLAAANTWYNVSWTWISTRKTTSRIDHIWLRHADNKQVMTSFIDDTTSLSLDGVDDHRPLAVKLW